MKRIRVIGLALVAVFALTAVEASSASAAGPLWLTAAGGKLAEGAEATGGVAKNVGGFTLKSSAALVLCSEVHSTFTLLGGMPAKDSEHIHFTNCTVDNGKGEAAPECKVRSKGAEAWGLILVKAKTVVLYIGTSTQAKNEEGPLGDLFTPETGTTFVELEFEGTCPTGVTSPTKVTGSVIGEISPVNSMTTKGKVVFPEKAISKGFEWEGVGKVKEVKASLKIFGTLTATQIGEAEVEFENGEEWGVTTT